MNPIITGILTAGIFPLVKMVIKAARQRRLDREAREDREKK